MTTAEEAHEFATRIVMRATEDGYEDLPSDVRQLAVRVLVDTVAVARAGAADSFCEAYIRQCVSGVSGPASVFGRRDSAPVALAAFLNALPTTVLQIDEGHRVSRGHPGIHVVPAAVAVGEQVGAGGESLVEALVCGYEVAVAVAALSGAPADGAHTHGTWGAFGAAAAAGRLMGADSAQMQAIIDAVAVVPMRPWHVTGPTGRTIHHLYVALAAQTGVEVAQAIMAGGTREPGAFESYYLRRFRDPATAWEPAQYEIRNNYFKCYATCAHLHTAIHAVESLRDTHGFGHGDVSRIDIHAFGAAAQLDDATPATNLAARFSMPFLVARTLVCGEVGTAVFEPSDLDDKLVLDLAARVCVHHDSTLDSGYPEGRPVRAQITLTDGRVLQREESVARGDTDRRTSDDEWREQVRRLVGIRTASRLFRFVDQPPAGWTTGDVARAASSAP